MRIATAAREKYVMDIIKGLAESPHK